MAELLAWQQALLRLMASPMLGASQARFLVESLAVDRPALLGFLLAQLEDPSPDRASDAAYVLEHILDARDRAAVEAYVAGDRPVRTRAWLRALYQNGLAHGRIKEDEAAIATPEKDVVPLYVEEVVRQTRRIPQPWQRARVAAEMLTGDAPLPDAAVTQAVTELADALGVPASQVWAELLVHPLTRAPWRDAADNALKQATQAAAPILELAHAALLPGPLQQRARTEYERHKHAATGGELRVRLGAPDPRGAVVATLQWHGGQPRAVGVAAFAQMGSQDVRVEEGLQCENVHLWAAGLAADAGGLWDVPAAAGLAMLAAACPFVFDDALLGKGKDGPRPQPALKAAWVQLAQLAGLNPQGELPALPSPLPLDPQALLHPWALNVDLLGTDLSEASRRELTKEMRARGRPKEDTVAAVCRDVANKKGVAARLRMNLEHLARLGALTAQGPVGVWAGMAAALEQPTSPSGQAVLATVLRKTLGALEVPAQGPMPVLTARDEVRDDVLPHAGVPKGMHVLAMDLAAAALDVSRGTPKALDGLTDDASLSLCVEAGVQAARAVVDTKSTASEELRLQDAAKAALKARAETLPSRQRRDLTDAWLKAWNELLTRACRGACNQQCLANLGEPRQAAAFALDHPRLNKGWP